MAKPRNKVITGKGKKRTISIGLGVMKHKLHMAKYGPGGTHVEQPSVKNAATTRSNLKDHGAKMGAPSTSKYGYDPTRPAPSHGGERYPMRSGGRPSTVITSKVITKSAPTSRPSTTATSPAPKTSPANRAGATAKGISKGAGIAALGAAATGGMAAGYVLGRGRAGNKKHKSHPAPKPGKRKTATSAGRIARARAKVTKAPGMLRAEIVGKVGSLKDYMPKKAVPPTSKAAGMKAAVTPPPPPQAGAQKPATGKTKAPKATTGKATSKKPVVVRKAQTEAAGKATSGNPQAKVKGTKGGRRGQIGAVSASDREAAIAKAKAKVAGKPSSVAAAATTPKPTAPATKDTPVTPKTKVPATSATKVPYGKRERVTTRVPARRKLGERYMPQGDRPVKMETKIDYGALERNRQRDIAEGRSPKPKKPAASRKGPKVKAQKAAAKEAVKVRAKKVPTSTAKLDKLIDDAAKQVKSSKTDVKRQIRGSTKLTASVAEKAGMKVADVEAHLKGDAPGTKPKGAATPAKPRAQRMPKAVRGKPAGKIDLMLDDIVRRHHKMPGGKQTLIKHYTADSAIMQEGAKRFGIKTKDLDAYLKAAGGPKKAAPEVKATKEGSSMKLKKVKKAPAKPAASRKSAKVVKVRKKKLTGEAKTEAVEQGYKRRQLKRVMAEDRAVSSQQAMGGQGKEARRKAILKETDKLLKKGITVKDPNTGNQVKIGGPGKAKLAKAITDKIKSAPTSSTMKYVKKLGLLGPILAGIALRERRKKGKPSS